MNAIKNTFKEFGNVSWPTFSNTMKNTFIVIVFCLIVGLISFAIISGFLPIFSNVTK